MIYVLPISNWGGWNGEMVEPDPVRRTLRISRGLSVPFFKFLENKRLLVQFLEASILTINLSLFMDEWSELHTHSDVGV